MLIVIIPIFCLFDGVTRNSPVPKGPGGKNKAMKYILPILPATLALAARLLPQIFIMTIIKMPRCPE